MKKTLTKIASFAKTLVLVLLVCNNQFTAIKLELPTLALITIFVTIDVINTQ